MITWQKRFTQKTSLLAAIAILLINASYLILVQTVHAAAFTNAYIRLDRMKASTTTGGTVCAKPATAGTEIDVQVTFPSGFTVNTTATNWTVTTTNLPAGSSAWVGIGTATAVSSQTVTFASGDVVVGTLYCFNFAAASTLTTSTAAADKTGVITTRATGPATIDTSEYATAIIADDQIAVTATVAPSFSFTLSGTTDALSTLSQTAVTSSPTPRTITVATNGPNGFITWVKDSNAGLTSTVASDTINTSGTVDDACSAAYSAGSEFYGLDADETTDPQTNGSIDAEYNCTATTVGAYSTTFTELASGTAGTSGYVLTLNNRAAAGNLNKPATDYADTVTVSGAGNF